MYGVIGNGETCAFISIFSSLDWLCLPRFDAPTMFAKVLDNINGGSITLSYEPGGTMTPFEAGQQRYLEDSNLLETTNQAGADIVRAIDFMPFGKHKLWRVLGVSGPDSFKLTVDINPRPDYNRAKPSIDILDNGLLISSPGQALLITSSVEANVKRKALTFYIQPPMTVPILLAYGSTPEEARKAANNSNYEREYLSDLKFWRNYSSEAYPVFDLNPKLHYFYMRSLLVLKLLMYDRTGAILAAPTTSFPEIVGQDKNWDYRFCWVRDGAYSAEALALAGLFQDSTKILDFILGIAKPDGKPYPNPLVSIDGDLLGTDEVDIETLVGFGNSKPVRIGNKAVGQKQNDLEGEVVHAVYTLYKYTGNLDYVKKNFGTISRIVDYVMGHWRDKDAGIWELRQPDMNYVHSKTMCWAALEYGSSLASAVKENRLASQWGLESEKVKVDIIKNGWSEKRKCFKRAYEDDSYDASVLVIPLMNMLPVEEPMVRMTVKSITDNLGTGGLLKRFAEEPNAFMLSSLWLAQVMIKRKKVVNALDIINRAARYASSDLGLFAEEYDMYYQRLVGNIPQSFSHEEFIKSVNYLMGKE